MNTHSKLLLLPRVLGGAPLLFFGVMHISGMMPMRPLIEAAHLPMPGAMSTIAPIAQIVAGVLLLAGAFTRAGAVVAIGTMLGALTTHLRIPLDAWPTPTATDPNAVGPQPLVMVALALIIIAASVVLFIKGPGAMAFDSRTEKPAHS